MAWPAVGVVGGGEASAASQPATGGKSTTNAGLGGWSNTGRKKPFSPGSQQPLDPAVQPGLNMRD